jgi:hypothetical protein
MSRGLKKGDLVMARNHLFAVVALVFIGIGSGAMADGHAITVCTTRTLVAGSRTDCRYEALPAERPSSLKGICITAYGNRACY